MLQGEMPDPIDAHSATRLLLRIDALVRPTFGDPTYKTPDESIGYEWEVLTGEENLNKFFRLATYLADNLYVTEEK
jgi:hypothetical protein